MDTLRNPWRGYYAHFLRQDKIRHKLVTKRCQIEGWAADKSTITMIVVFQLNGVRKRKSVSPQQLAAVNVSWIDSLAVSDTDEDEPETPAKNSFYVLAPLPNELLPSLDLTETELLMVPQDVKKALLFAIRETNDILSLAQQRITKT